MVASRSSSRDSFTSAASDSQPFHPATSTSTTSPYPNTSTSASEPTTSRLPPAEEAALLTSSHSTKATANALFAAQDFSSAIQSYDKALAELPDYLDYEIAVLKANVAACHLKLEEWKEAVDAASAALDRLETLDPSPKVQPVPDKIKIGTNEDGVARRKREAAEAQAREEAAQEAGVLREIDEETEAAHARLEAAGHTLEEVSRLRVKALMRRARARGRIGTWSELSGAEEDYKTLLRLPRGTLSVSDRTSVEREARVLNPRLEEAKQREMAEMLGKLKGLGNGLLKPFGLNLDMFNMVKDEKTGGYSMNLGGKGEKG